MPQLKQENKELVDTQKINTVRTLLEKSKAQIAMALPRHMTPDKMLRTAMTSIQRTPKLLECHPISLMGAIIQAAQLGLYLDSVTGMAYLVPFWNSQKSRFEVQLIPGYRGLLSLARRSGEIGPVVAKVVYEKDSFEYQHGIHPELAHIPSKDEDPGKPVFIYAIAFLKDPAFKECPPFEVMNVNEINKIRNRSKAKDSGPWVTDWEEMAKKTVIRRMYKYLPVSTELETAIALDERGMSGIPQDLGLLADMTEMGTDINKTPVLENKQDAKLEAPESPAEYANDALVFTVIDVLKKNKIEFITLPSKMMRVSALGIIEYQGDKEKLIEIVEEIKANSKKAK